MLAQAELLKLYCDLYKAFRTEININSGLHYQHFQRYLTLITALLGATLFCIYRSQNSSIFIFFVFFVSILNIAICYIGNKMCDSFYKGVLEVVAVSAKLEGLLGLLDLRLNSDHPRGSFPEDNYVVPKRWIEERGCHQTSEKFIEASMKSGSNRYTRRTFRVMAYANAIVAVSYIAWLKFN